MIAFAGLALADRQYQTAARLLGYMEPKLVDIIQKMEFYDKIEFDHHTARVKEALDEADLAACWAEGRAITLEQAINMARRLGGGTTTISSSVAVVFLS